MYEYYLDHSIDASPFVEAAQGAHARFENKMPLRPLPLPQIGTRPKLACGVRVLGAGVYNHQGEGHWSHISSSPICTPPPHTISPPLASRWGYLPGSRDEAVAAGDLIAVDVGVIGRANVAGNVLERLHGSDCRQVHEHEQHTRRSRHHVGHSGQRASPEV